MSQPALISYWPWAGLRVAVRYSDLLLRVLLAEGCLLLLIVLALVVCPLLERSGSTGLRESGLGRA